MEICSKLECKHGGDWLINFVVMNVIALGGATYVYATHRLTDRLTVSQNDRAINPMQSGRLSQDQA